MSSTDLQRTQSCSPGAHGAAGVSAPTRDARTPGALEPRRALLAFGGPRDVLARIVDGDPLGLRPLLAARVRGRCLLVDADRVHLRALALCARHAPSYRGRPALEEWLTLLVDRALDEVIDEEAQRLVRSSTSHEVEDGAFAQLARPLGLAPEEARRACARFNRLPQEQREAFHAWVLERGTLDELARRTGLGASEFARRARRALSALLGAPPGPGAQSHALDESHAPARPAVPTGIDRGATES